MTGPILPDRRGSVGAEFALVLPMLLVLMFGGLEAGHFFWTEHKLIKAVRDGARYAARMDIDKLCNGATQQLDADVQNEIQRVTSTGQVAAGGAPKVPGWSAGAVTITVGCEQFVDTGIYTDLGTKGPVVTVSSGSVTYPSLFAGLGFIDSSIKISAESSTPVLGV